MEITCLVENKEGSNSRDLGMIPAHGLSLYIKTTKHRLLFDLGPNETLINNALIKGIDLSEVDTVIISHGHNDHGGGLKYFLKYNQKAKVYIQRKAFASFYSLNNDIKHDISLDLSLMNHPQVVLIDGDYQIDEELSLIHVRDKKKCYSEANDALYADNKHDDFSHEQNLVIDDGIKALFVGCCHSGIVNALEETKDLSISLCVGGFHVYNPRRGKTVSNSTLSSIKNELAKYPNIDFFTCHCTGMEAFNFFNLDLSNIFYLACGDSFKR